MRHFAVAIIFVLSLFAVYQALWLIRRSKIQGLMGTALYAATPLLLGHSMMNIKDSPVASGYTIFTIGLFLSLQPFGQRKFIAVMGGVWISIGMFIVLGTRPAGWPLLAGSLVLGLVATRFLRRAFVETFDDSLLVSTARLAVSLATGYLFLLLLYPMVFSQPISLFRDSLGQATSYPWDWVTLTNGVEASSRPGFGYILTWIFHQTPLVYLSLALLSLAWATFMVLCRTDVEFPFSNVRVLLFICFASLQTLLPLLGAVVTDSVLYNGTRQLLMSTAGMSLLAAAGLLVIVNHLSSQGDIKQRGVLALIPIGLIVTTVSSVWLYPYGYAYFNSVATISGVDGKWETDYWRASSNELSAEFISTPRPAWDSRSSDNLRDCRPSFDAPMYTQLWKSSDVIPGSESKYLCTSYGRVTEGCRAITEVQRKVIVGEPITMSGIYECEMSIELSEGSSWEFSVETDDSGQLVSAGKPYLLWGWQLNADLGTFAYQESAGVGLRSSLLDRSENYRLTIQGRPAGVAGFPDEVTFWFNGNLLGSHTYETDSQDQSVSWQLPSELMKADEGVLRLGRASTGPPLYFFLERITVERVS